VKGRLCPGKEAIEVLLAQQEYKLAKRDKHLLMNKEEIDGLSITQDSKPTKTDKHSSMEHKAIASLPPVAQHSSLARKEEHSLTEKNRPRDPLNLLLMERQQEKQMASSSRRTRTPGPMTSGIKQKKLGVERSIIAG
jgi:hypothetical protein